MGKAKKRYNSNARRKLSKSKHNTNRGYVYEDATKDSHVSDVRYSTTAEPNSEVLSISKKDKAMKEIKSKKFLSKKKKKQLAKIKEKMQKSAKVFAY